MDFRWELLYAGPELEFEGVEEEERERWMMRRMDMMPARTSQRRLGYRGCICKKKTCHRLSVEANVNFPVEKYTPALALVASTTPLFDGGSMKARGNLTVPAVCADETVLREGLEGVLVSNERRAVFSNAIYRKTLPIERERMKETKSYVEGGPLEFEH